MAAVAKLCPEPFPGWAKSTPASRASHYGRPADHVHGQERCNTRSTRPQRRLNNSFPFRRWRAEPRPPGKCRSLTMLPELMQGPKPTETLIGGFLHAVLHHSLVNQDVCSARTGKDRAGRLSELPPAVLPKIAFRKASCRLVFCEGSCRSLDTSESFRAVIGRQPLHLFRRNEADGAQSRLRSRFEMAGPPFARNRGGAIFQLGQAEIKYLGTCPSRVTKYFPA